MLHGILVLNPSSPWVVASGNTPFPLLAENTTYPYFPPPRHLLRAPSRRLVGRGYLSQSHRLHIRRSLPRQRLLLLNDWKAMAGDVVVETGVEDS